MRNNFTGIAVINGLDTKNPYSRSGKTKGKNPTNYKSFNLGIESAKNNTGFIELFGMDVDEINTKDTEGNDITISKSDFDDPDVIKEVANYKKNIINLTESRDSRKEFISPYAAVEYLCEHADEIKGKKLCVTGQTVPNIYEGKVTQRFQLQNLYVVDENTKPSLKVTGEFYFNREGIDTSDWKEEKKVSIDGYVSEFISKKDLGTDKGMNKYVPFRVVLDCSKLDLSNEKHLSLLDIKLMGLGLKYEDGKVVIDNLPKKNKYVCQNVELNYVNGNEEVEFTYDMLTDFQKKFVDNGLKTVDDFRPAGQTYGNRVTIFKLTGFDSRVVGKKDFSEGFIELDETAEEFEENIFVPVKEETLDDIMNDDEEEDVVNTSSSDDDDDEDLFG